MSDINWNLAPEGAVEIRQLQGGALCWFNVYKKYYNGLYWCKSEYPSDVIAIRPQTKTVADEQEGEKWTHTYAGDKCFLLEPNKDPDGYYAIKTDCGLFELAKGHELKPIKPKLTESAMLSRIAELSRGTLSDAECGDKIRELFDTVDII
jgi:hypothetical protein